MSTKPSSDRSPRLPARIAVIEDDRDLREVTVEFLRDSGYAASGFETAEAFYRHLATHFIDVVIVDIGLPGEDGLSVVRHLGALPDLRIIILSAAVSEEDRRAGLLAGAGRYLIKPVVLDELALSIETELACKPGGSDRAARGVVTGSVGSLWLLNKVSWQLTAPSGATLTLSSREFAFLRCVMLVSGNTVPQETVASSVYSSRVDTRHERTDVLLSRLRKKCLQSLGLALPVRTVHLVGYVFTAAARVE